MMMQLRAAGIIDDCSHLTTVAEVARDQLTVVTRFGVGPRLLATITSHPMNGATVEYEPDIKKALFP
jgi:hypothetical protein